MAVLDTSMLVELIRRRPTPRGRRAISVIRELLAADEALMTTRFNVAELYVGAALADDPDTETGRILELLRPFQILDFDDRAARAYAQIEASLRRAGRPVGDFDALIASVALSHGQPLVTHNPRHFVEIPGLIVRAVV